MGINRAEKEVLDAVTQMASPAGELRAVVDAVSEFAENVSSILNSGNITLPDVMEEHIRASIKDLEGFRENWVSKATLLSDANARLSEDIAARVAEANRSADDTAQQRSAAKTSTEEIQGGVR